MRSNSESLATKCLTVHADALRLHAGDVRDRHARREERILGVALEVAARERVRWMLTVGASSTCACLRRASSPSRCPTSCDELGVPRRAERGAARERSPTAGPTTARRARRSARR